MKGAPHISPPGGGRLVFSHSIHMADPPSATSDLRTRINSLWSMARHVRRSPEKLPANRAAMEKFELCMCMRYLFRRDLHWPTTPRSSCYVRGLQRRRRRKAHWGTPGKFGYLPADTTKTTQKIRRNYAPSGVCWFFTAEFRLNNRIKP